MEHQTSMKQAVIAVRMRASRRTFSAPSCICGAQKSAAPHKPAQISAMVPAHSTRIGIATQLRQVKATSNAITGTTASVICDVPRLSRNWSVTTAASASVCGERDAQMCAHSLASGPLRGGAEIEADESIVDTRGTCIRGKTADMMLKLR